MVLYGYLPLKMCHPQKKYYFLIIFFFIIGSLNTSSFAKANVSEVVNDVFVLDIYGKRYVLANVKLIKKGDYLKTKKKPAYLILNDKTKICLAANTSIKILDLKNIGNKIEYTFDFNKGDLLLDINQNKSNIYNLHFSFYEINGLPTDLILSYKKQIKLINFEGKLKIFSKKSQKKINLDPYSDYKLIPNGSIKKSSKLLNLDPFNDEFHSDCKKVLPQHEIEKNKKWELQYGCISQEGRLVCGNRIK